jgi:hypothetical protein
MESDAKSAAQEPHPWPPVDQYTPPKVVALGNFHELTRSGLNPTAFDGVEQHS